VGEGVFCFVQVIGREGQQAAKDTDGDIIKMGGETGKNGASEPPKPDSPAKTDSLDSNRKKVTSLVLLNEQGSVLLEWSLQSKTALIIGKSNGKDNVDVDLSGSAVADMVSKQHAVLNYTDNGWYIDDIDSKNGTRVKKKYQSALLDVKLVGAVEVEAGDIIYIANAMLQIR
jgi:pSer/pThr/pTyr-binding forkhead associated (FHA) protein